MQKNKKNFLKNIENPLEICAKYVYNIDKVAQSGAKMDGKWRKPNAYWRI
jgi:hypothetical protein